MTWANRLHKVLSCLDGQLGQLSSRQGGGSEFVHMHKGGPKINGVQQGEGYENMPFLCM